jgi:D-arabinono-1,4-lactone oxidase
VYSYEIKRFARSVSSNQIIYYPTNESEIQALIRNAYQDGSTIVRVIGSGHSYDQAIFDEQDLNAKQKLTMISLENYHGVTIDKKNNVAIIKAGTVIGPNPEINDENIEESLVWILDQAGYAVPDLAGITRQTVAGFLSTGSAGGSLLYSFPGDLVGIRLIDGKGTIHDISKNDYRFNAVGVSMGLLGIITSVNMSLTTKSYYIKGSETTSPIAPPSSNLSVGCPIDMFGDGNGQYPSLTKFLQTGAEFLRVLWFPQKGFDRAVIWKASKYDRKPLPPIVPYQEFPGSNITAVSLEIAEALIIMNELAANTKEYYLLVDSILDQIIPIGEQDFFDIYYNSLPMDNDLSYQVLPYSFSEL